MSRLKQFSLQHPFLFGLLVIILYALLTTVSYPVHFLFPESEIGQLYGDAASKLLVFLAFILLLARFGWLSAAGVTRLGSGRLWLVVAAITIYLIIAEVYAFTGAVAFVAENDLLAQVIVFGALATSLVEETMYRGLVLLAMVIAWGGTRRGQIGAVLGSASIFGLLHLLNLLARPPAIVLLQAVMVVLPGILYAALTLRGRTLWPAIFVHWLTNAAVNLQILAIPDFAETIQMWLFFGLAMAPVMVYSAYLLTHLPPTLTVLSEPKRPLVGLPAGAKQAAK